MSWGYGTKNGPTACWNKTFPIGAEGQRQSPIDIQAGKCVVDAQLAEHPLKMNYEPTGKHKLTNTGASWKVDYQGDSHLTGGPLKNDTYALEQYHCHWGDASDRGSEHTVDGAKYSAELHLVHYNTKYDSFSDAANKSDGLAVLGVFLQAGQQHEELDKVAKALEKVSHKGKSVEIDSCDPDLFLPNTTKYCTYEGSLTTPPLYESVTWIVFCEPVEVSEQQIMSFRHMKRHSDQGEKGEESDEDEGRIGDNYRPPVPQGNRVVRCCESVLRKTK